MLIEVIGELFNNAYQNYKFKITYPWKLFEFTLKFLI